MKCWFVVGLICLPFATGAIAKDKPRQLGAHEHGHGNFNIAIEGNKVNMELESPGADIVGFEYKASTDMQKAVVSKAKEKLKDITKVVGLPDAAGCKIEKVNVELHIEGADKETSHSEFHVEYEMICAASDKLVEITFPYFRNFKGAHELEVNVASPKSQKKFEVERDTAKISLGGII